MNKQSCLFIMSMLAASVLSACSDSSDSMSDLGPLTPDEEVFGKATGNFTAEEWYPGGELGTTEKASYSAITPAAEQAGMEEDFNTGEGFFEKLYTFEQEPRKGLGPAWVYCLSSLVWSRQASDGVSCQSDWQRLSAGHLSSRQQCLYQ